MGCDCGLNTYDVFGLIGTTFRELESLNDKRYNLFSIERPGSRQVQTHGNSNDERCDSFLPSPPPSPPSASASARATVHLAQLHTPVHVVREKMTLINACWSFQDSCMCMSHDRVTHANESIGNTVALGTCYSK